MFRRFITMPFLGCLATTIIWCSCSSPSSPVSRVQDIPETNSEMIEQVTISENDLHAFVSSDTLEVIARNLTEYFAATNEGRWDDLMHHFPMHKKQGDTAFVQSSKEALDHWTERGVRNRTAAAEIVYASPAFADGDQQVILLNMELSHFVEFYPNYDGPRPDGMKGMVESNYGKGNAVYKEEPLAPGDSLPLRYWEVSGLNRIWAVSHVDSAHWCFLPPNFNESGAASMMGANAMVDALRHRRANDPTAER
ncbi:MAG TPA: hypothetical protein DD635_08490 [Flavobacteriales bacterium]|nr:hypothetical protein [Flavobacteriales bacterium]